MFSLKGSLVDVSDIFYFLCSGRGKGESEAPGGEGGGVFIENPRRGGLQDGRGREGVCGELGNFGGRGSKYFFWGARMSTKGSLLFLRL